MWFYLLIYKKGVPYLLLSEFNSFLQEYHNMPRNLELVVIGVCMLLLERAYSRDRGLSGKSRKNKRRIPK